MFKVHFKFRGSDVTSAHPGLPLQKPQRVVEALSAQRLHFMAGRREQSAVQTFDVVRRKLGQNKESRFSGSVTQDKLRLRPF